MKCLKGLLRDFAARRASPAEIAVLRELINEDQQRTNNVTELASSNRRFHRQLHRCSHNRYLIRMLESMRRSLALLSGTTLGAPGRGQASIDEHDRIVTALEARDEEAAEAAARKHTVNAYKTRLKIEASR